MDYCDRTEVPCEYRGEKNSCHCQELTCPDIEKISLCEQCGLKEQVENLKTLLREVERELQGCKDDFTLFCQTICERPDHCENCGTHFRTQSIADLLSKIQEAIKD